MSEKENINYGQNKLTTWKYQKQSVYYGVSIVIFFYIHAKEVCVSSKSFHNNIDIHVFNDVKTIKITSYIF